MRVRQATHAGSWYSHEEQELDTQLTGTLKILCRKPSFGMFPFEAKDRILCTIRAIIAPHAGFRYSGLTAAHAYHHLQGLEHVKRVFILGPSHHFYLRGCAVSTAVEYETPLGNIEIDHAINEQLIDTGKFVNMSLDVDEDEHSIEMHLPFIVKVMNGRKFTAVPILVGDTKAKMDVEYGKFRYQPHDSTYGEIHEYIKYLDHEGMQVRTNPFENGAYATRKAAHNGCNGSACCAGIGSVDDGNSDDDQQRSWNVFRSTVCVVHQRSFSAATTTCVAHESTGMEALDENDFTRVPGDKTKKHSVSDPSSTTLDVVSNKEKQRQGEQIDMSRHSLMQLAGSMTTSAPQEETPAASHQEQDEGERTSASKFVNAQTDARSVVSVTPHSEEPSSRQTCIVASDIVELVATIPPEYPLVRYIAESSFAAAPEDASVEWRLFVKCIELQKWSLALVLAEKMQRDHVIFPQQRKREALMQDRAMSADGDDNEAEEDNTEERDVILDFLDTCSA
ncbi:Memo-like protein, partial [Globisporangium splendens]